MNILIAGASGFIGHALVHSLKVDHHLTVLGRNKTTLQQEFSNVAICCTWDELPHMIPKQFDAIINLCGFNIAASRWSDTIKKQLINSRVDTNTLLIQWLIKHQSKPHFICANAVGIYGLQDHDDPSYFDEDTFINTSNPPDFLSEIGICWQEALKPAVDFGIPVTITRFGVVLQKDQGMLKKLFPSFYAGLGATIGDGHQSLSWIHINDVIGAVTFLLNKPELTGAFNLTSPYPVSQEIFARELASCLHRPLFLKIPSFFIRLIFGEMGECLLLKGQRVLPKRLLAAGYQFQYPRLIQALQREFKNR